MAAEELLPKPPKRSKKAVWYDPRIEKALRSVQEAHLNVIQESTQDSRANLQSATNILSGKYEEVNKEILRDKVKQVEIANQNCRHKKSSLGPN